MYVLLLELVVFDLLIYFAQVPFGIRRFTPK